MKLLPTSKFIPLLGVITIFGCTTPKEKHAESFSTFVAGETYYGKLVAQDVKGPFYITWEPENNCFLAINKRGQKMKYTANSIREIRFKPLTKEQQNYLDQLRTQK